jgi:hypothetical protein
MSKRKIHYNIKPIDAYSRDIFDPAGRCVGWRNYETARTLRAAFRKARHLARVYGETEVTRYVRGSVRCTVWTIPEAAHA